MKRLLVYPFNRDFLPILRVSELMEKYEITELVAPGGFGLTGKAFVCNDREYIVSDDFSGALSRCDGVIIASWWQNIDLDEILIRKIEEALDKGKEVIFPETVLKRNILSHLNGDDSERKIVAFKSQCYKETEKAVLRVGVPVVFVVGATQNVGKFETSILLKQRFVSQGYKVALIASRSEALLFGDYFVPNYMFDSSLSEAARIYAFSRFVKNIELKERPDLIIIGVPGAVMPFRRSGVDDFGFVAGMMTYAVSPDAVVLCSLCPLSESGRPYFGIMEKSLHDRLGMKVAYHFVSEYTVDMLTEDKKEPVQYMSLDHLFAQKRVLQMGIEACSVVGDPEGINKAVNSIEDLLS